MNALTMAGNAITRMKEAADEALRDGKLVIVADLDDVLCLLNRAVHGDDQPLEVGPLRIDPSSRRVTVSSLPVTLTRTEYDILWTIARKRGGVATFSQIIEGVWPDYQGRIETLKVRMVDLRRKLGVTSGQGSIQNVRGVGFRIAMEEQ